MKLNAAYSAGENQARQGTFEQAKEENYVLNYMPGVVGYGALTSDEAPSKQKNDSIDALLFGQKDFLRQKLSWFYKNIEDRKKLYHGNLHHLVDQECKIGSKILQLDERFRWSYSPGKIVDKRRGGLEQEMHSIHQEKRRNRTETWRDLQRIYQELSEVLEEYEHACRNNNLLQDEQNER